METDYEKWKAGKKIYKAPWVIRHYESITDFNQYKLGKVVVDRIVLFTGVMFLLIGIAIGYFIFR